MGYTDEESGLERGRPQVRTQNPQIQGILDNFSGGVGYTGNTPGDNVMVMPDYGPNPVSGHNSGQADKDAYDAYLREKDEKDRAKGIYGVKNYKGTRQKSRFGTAYGGYGLPRTLVGEGDNSKLHPTTIANKFRDTKHYLNQRPQTKPEAKDRIQMSGDDPLVLVMKGKLGTALTAASILAAPFTGGASLAAGAAARAAMVGVQGGRALLAGRKAAQAGKGLQSAQAASATAQVNKIPVKRKRYAKQGQNQSMADVNSGKTTQLSDFGDIGDVTEGAGSKVGVTQPAEGGSHFDNVAERGAEGPQGIDTNPAGPNASQQTTLSNDAVSALNNQNTAQVNSDKMNERLQESRDAYKESVDINTPMGEASAVGAYGFNQLEQHKQQNQAKQQAEMKRIEDLSSAGRAKASTGTGGQVAVA